MNPAQLQDATLPSGTGSLTQERIDAYQFSQQVGHLLRRSYQRHVAIFQRSIPDSPLTATQFVFLCALHAQGPCSINDLVRATAIDQGTARGVVDRLKVRGLLVIDHDPHDKRKVLIRSTPEGEELVREMVPFALQITEDTFGNLSSAERVALVFLLQKMSSLPKIEGASRSRSACRSSTLGSGGRQQDGATHSGSSLPRPSMCC